MTRIFDGSLLVLVLVLSAATLSPSRPAARSILVLPATPYRYANVKLPAHFTQAGRNHDNTPPNNPVSDDGATLGRVLFYDTRLSANRTTSCASCHVQTHAFADPKPISKGFHGAPTDRRAMPLVNVRYYQRSRFFWDERAGDLEEMMLLPIQSRIEMGQDLKQVVDTLTRDPMYPVLFGRAFGDRQITEQRIGKALAQFVRPIVSYQSRYDEGRARAQSAQDGFPNFTVQGPERMQNLVAGGDANTDAALDSNEIRYLVNAGSPEPPRVPLLPQPSEGLPGVIRDLKLPPPKQAEALAIVSAHKLSRHFNDPTGSTLYAKMRTVLDDEEYENFVAAAARVSRSSQIIK